MNDLSASVKILAEFAEKMSQAGFTPGSFTGLVEKLPDHRFGNLSEGLARKLYLAYIGLAEFSLKSGVIEMYDQHIFSEKENAYFRKCNWAEYTIHKDDKNLFAPKIDLTRLDIMSPLFSGEKKINLEEALRRVTGPNIGIEFANFWHARWLFDHQEFIPEKWRDICRARGRIIFPRVRLIRDRGYTSTESNELEIHYPSFSVDSGGYKYEFTQSLQINYGGPKYPEVFCKDKDFFAFFRPVEKAIEKSAK
jgi:hypothetical protein